MATGQSADAPTGCKHISNPAHGGNLKRCIVCTAKQLGIVCSASKHRLAITVVSNDSDRICDVCNKSARERDVMATCDRCEFDVCENCVFDKPTVPSVVRSINLRFAHKLSHFPLFELKVASDISVTDLRAMVEKKLMDEETTPMRGMDCWYHETTIGPKGLKGLVLIEENESEDISDLGIEDESVLLLEGPMTDTLEGIGRALATLGKQNQEQQRMVQALSEQVMSLTRELKATKAELLASQLEPLATQERLHDTYAEHADMPMKALWAALNDKASLVSPAVPMAIIMDPRCGIERQAVDEDEEMKSKNGVILNRNVNQDPLFGATPLMLAILAERPDVVEALLVSGASARAVDSKGRTPLHIAVEVGNSVMDLLSAPDCVVDAADEDGNTPLHIATSHGRIAEMKMLINGGARVDSANNRKETPLHAAAVVGCCAAAKLLIARGAPLEAGNIHNLTPLHVAVLNGNIKFVQILLSKGGNPAAQDDSGETALHMAARRGHVKAIELLLGMGVPVNSETFDGETPLHLASYDGHLEAMTLLLAKGANANAVDREHESPLDKAYYYGGSRSGNAAKALLRKHGAQKYTRESSDSSTEDSSTDDSWDAFESHRDTENDTKEDTEEETDAAGSDWEDEEDKCDEAEEDELQTPLHMAILSGDLDAMERIISKRGAAVNETTKEGDTPLHIAAAVGNPSAIRLLAAKLAKYGIDAPNLRGQTPLHIAVDKGDVAATEVLIGNEASIHKVDKKGNTPLHISGSKGHLLIAELLCEQKARLNESNRDGDTPLHLAASNGHAVLMELLIDRGANVHAKNRDGESPLHCAAKSRVCAWPQWKLPIEVLLRNGANIHENRRDGHPLLHMAIWSIAKCVEAIAFLVSKGASLEAVNDSSHTQTILHKLIESEDFTLVKGVIELGANIHATDNDGLTPLHVAVRSNNLEIIDLLLSKGANINALTHSGDTPLLLATVMRPGPELALMGLLIVRGRGTIDLNVRNNGGFTALRWATVMEETTSIKLLKTAGAIH